MINLLYVINFLNNGGPSNVLKNLAFSLDQKKYQITVLTLVNENDRGIVKEFQKRNIKIVPLDYNKSLKTISKNKNSIIKKINSLHADIIHTHGIVGTILVANKNIKGKKITTVHNALYDDYKYTYGKLKGALLTKLHLKALKRFDKTIFCSESSYSLYKSKIKNSTFIRNEITPKAPMKNARTKIRRELNLKNTDIVFVYGGVLNERKGSCELAELFSKHHKPNEYLLLVGDGPAAENIKSLNDNHLILTGFKDNLTDYFAASDVYISNSHAEGLSVSIIEALSLGLPLFLRDIPSHRECIDLGSNYLGETFTPETFAEKLETLRKNYQSVKPFKVTAKSMAKQYAELYENTTKERLKFSIVIPAYNAEHTLAKSIESIRSQSYTNFEIIIINDGSTDQTWLLCQNYTKKDARIKIVNQQNSGPSRARNKGLQKATGDYILFVDSDDLLLKDALKTLAKTIRNHPCDVIHYNYLSGPSQNLNGKTFKNPDVPKLLDSFLNDSPPCYSWLMCIKKSCLIKYDETLKHHEDVELIVRLLLHIDSIYFLDQPLYQYNYNPSGITKDPKKALANIKYVQQSYQKIKQLLKENHLLSKNLDQQINANIFKITVDKLRLYADLENTEKILPEIFESPIYAEINPAMLTPKLRQLYRLISEKRFTVVSKLIHFSRIKGARHES